MKKVRRVRKEERNAEDVTRILQERARKVFGDLRDELDSLPSLQEQRKSAPHVSESEWRTYLAKLILAAFRDESIERVVDQFNSTYVNPFRPKRIRPPERPGVFPFE